MLVGTCILFILIIVIIVIALFWWISYWVLFYPSRQMLWEPDIPYMDIYLPLDPKRKGEYYLANTKRPTPCINVWYFNQLLTKRRGNSKTTILYFHGNSGNISHREYIVDICKRFGINLLLVDYTGYGRSDGIVSPNQIYRDGETAYNFLLSEVGSDNIVIWGESLGGTVACHVASNYDCRCLILLATFSSLEDVMIQSGYSNWSVMAMSKMTRMLLNPMESKRYLEKIKCPVAIMHSQCDTLIPHFCGKILYESIPHENKMFFDINGDHASPDIDEDTLASLLAFAGIQGQCMDDDLSYVTDLLQKVCQEQEGLIPDKLKESQMNF